MRAKLFGAAALALSFALLLAAGVSSQQPRPAGPELPPPGVSPAGDPPGANPRPPLADVKQLMAELAQVRKEKEAQAQRELKVIEQLRQEKAALAQKEQELLALLRQRLAEQRKALQDLERQVRELEGPRDLKARGKDRDFEKK
ncbi:MAG TPA: hypothetical protein VFE78_23165 [Gemmataceae bacterium]|jgi:hypothetical protein|nr:hypothetical protein [Gemmataceae bacterium]